jgi:phosphoribosylglycinamide formyltransferase-1
MNRCRTAILISGRGSNMKALLAAGRSPDYPARFVLVIANEPGAPGLAAAALDGVATRVVNHRDYDGREEFERAIDAELSSAAVDLICLAGFVRLLTPWFVDKWRDRLINIHPSLLPELKGLNTHERALRAGVKVHGCTVHQVRAQMDDGPIILQKSVPVLAGDTADSLAARVLRAEHQIYCQAVALVARARMTADAAAGERSKLADPKV